MVDSWRRVALREGPRARPVRGSGAWRWRWAARNRTGQRGAPGRVERQGNRGAGWQRSGSWFGVRHGQVGREGPVVDRPTRRMTSRAYRSDRAWLAWILAHVHLGGHVPGDQIAVGTAAMPSSTTRILLLWCSRCWTWEPAPAVVGRVGIPAEQGPDPPTPGLVRAVARPWASARAGPRSPPDWSRLEPPSAPPMHGSGSGCTSATGGMVASSGQRGQAHLGLVDLPRGGSGRLVFSISVWMSAAVIAGALLVKMRWSVAIRLSRYWGTRQPHPSWAWRPGQHLGVLRDGSEPLLTHPQSGAVARDGQAVPSATAGHDSPPTQSPDSARRPGSSLVIAHEPRTLQAPRRGVDPLRISSAVIRMSPPPCPIVPSWCG